MSNPIKDIIVIGAGIIGTCIAERLSYLGQDVCLLDRLEPGEGCSKGHAGHFATDIVTPLANFRTLLMLPKLIADPLGPLAIRWQYLPKLIPWFLRFFLAAMPHKSKASSDALAQLNRPSIDVYTEILKRTGLEYLMTKNGAFTVYESDASVRKDQSTFNILKEYGVNFKLLQGDQIREMEPDVNTAVKAGLYFPDTAHSINPSQLVKSLAKEFIKNGGQYLQAQINNIITKDNHIELITDSGIYRAKKIVIATGAWSKPFAKMTGYHVPLEIERGYHLMLPNSGKNVTRPIVSYERSFVITPMQEGLRLAGTVEFGGLDAPMNNNRADILYKHASAILSGVEKSDATKWMGFRSSLPDSLPVIDQSKKHPGVYYAFGHQHLGFTQAAVTAELLSNIILNLPNTVDCSAYRINRF